MRSLRLPLTAGPQGLATVEVDSDEDVAQSVALLLDTRPGERRSVPEYGLPDPLFIGVDLDVVAGVVEEWEPRADPLFIEQLVDGALDVVGVTVRAESPTAYGGLTPVAPPPPVVPLAPVAWDVDGEPYLTPWAERTGSGIGFDTDGTPYLTAAAGTPGAVVDFDTDGTPYLTEEV